jgi:iron complex transport system substrate-binding protein
MMTCRVEHKNEPMIKIFKNYFLLGLLTFVLSTPLISQNKLRIISLAPSLTHDLILMGVQDQIVGITNYCENNTAKSIPVVASAIDVNIERVVSLKPDLVIATSLTNPEVQQSLKNFGIKMVYFPLPKSFDEINKQFLELGKLLDREVVAEKIIDQEKAKVASLKKMIPQVNNPKIFVQIGIKPLFCVIPDTFLDDYITYAGGVNATNDLKNGSVSRESVLLRNPDVIVLVTMGNVGEEEKKNWMNYTSVNAVKNKQIFIVDSDIACSPTPDHFTQTLKLFINFLYKNNKNE